MSSLERFKQLIAIREAWLRRKLADSEFARALAVHLEHEDEPGMEAYVQGVLPLK